MWILTTRHYNTYGELPDSRVASIKIWILASDISTAKFFLLHTMKVETPNSG